MQGPRRGGFSPRFPRRLSPSAQRGARGVCTRRPGDRPRTGGRCTPPGSQRVSAQLLGTWLTEPRGLGLWISSCVHELGPGYGVYPSENPPKWVVPLTQISQFRALASTAPTPPLNPQRLRHLPAKRGICQVLGGESPTGNGKTPKSKPSCSEKPEVARLELFYLVSPRNH